MKFERKWWGRIFVEKEEDIERIKDIMREQDKYEFEQYYPRGATINDPDYGELVTVFGKDKPQAVYTHKFDSMDMTKVLIEAWSRGIKCFMIDGKITGYEGS